MRVSALSSGSSANSFYIENDDSAILIDDGLSFKELNHRLAQIKRNSDKLNAIFITHEHSDHIKGVDVLARTCNIPIYLTKETAKNGFVCSNEELINHIKNNETIEINKLKINAFSKSHDAENPVSYCVEEKDKKVSIITDIGFPCKNVISNINDSDFVFFESNHDENMLKNGPYPYFLKNRILGDKGHLSNLQSSLCLLEHSDKKLNHIVLSHLSENNNTEEIAFNTCKQLLKERSDLKPKISVSTRDHATGLFNV